MLYNIANTLIELKNIKNEYLDHRLSAYLVTDTHIVPDITFNFKYNENIIVPEGKDFNRLDTWYWIDRKDEGYSAIKQESHTRITLNRIDFDKSCSNVTIEYFNIDGVFDDFSTDQMLHHILGDAFSFCQITRGNTLLHSAAVSYKGQAVLFSAPSGAGKSTHASLWKRYYPDDVVLFNDDTPIIVKDKDGLLACGTPWSGKTEINENIAAPIAAIVFIEQSDKNSIRTLSTLEAIVKLLNQTKKTVFKTLMEKHIELINEIIRTTPIYELKCDISKDAVEVVKNRIFTQE